MLPRLFCQPDKRPAGPAAGKLPATLLAFCFTFACGFSCDLIQLPSAAPENAGVPDSPGRARSTSSRMLAAQVPADTEQSVFYRGRSMPRREYRALLAAEAADFRKRLQRDFDRSFRIAGFKNFQIAWPDPAGPATRKKSRVLTQYVRAFYEQVYPRYFKYEPRRPFRIVYFANGPEFRAATGSPAYGFYRPGEHVLYTYLNSGHGTLWHELIHAFAAENSRHSLTPQWFSEGFASFYEMAFLIDGRVSEGYTNWRLPAMQAGLRADRIAPLRVALARPRFRMLDRDVTPAESRDRAAGEYGYAEARFLFCYLWVEGLLEPFVRDVLYKIRPRVLEGDGDRAGKANVLGPAIIQHLEKLTGKPIEEVDREIRALALRLGRNEKLKQKRSL